MGEKIYLISEAAKLVGVESHVLRYWEEELELDIGRTEQGHRYYTEENIHMLQNIRDLKEQGIQLKAIKTLLEHRQQSASGGQPQLQEWEDILSGREPEAAEGNPEEEDPLEECAVALTGTIETTSKLAQFEQILELVVERVVERNNEELEERLSRVLREELAGMQPEKKKKWPFRRWKK